MTVFREYPYCYEGDLHYEQDYLAAYFNSPNSVAVLVMDQGQVVGATTAIPLCDAESVWQLPFVQANRAIEDYFYLGESVLLPAYRGRGLYRAFFARREALARELAAKYTVFCAVIRSDSDPRRPAGYRSMAPIWQHFGYQKMEKMIASMDWKVVGATEESSHALQFWCKQL
jgi:GNAT superfamily N-acetyltransferase